VVQPRLIVAIKSQVQTVERRYFAMKFLVICIPVYIVQLLLIALAVRLIENQFRRIS
jgi:hypothetical protein